MQMKCQPPKGPYYQQDFIACKDSKYVDSLFMKNIKDVAATIEEILIVCGISRDKANATKSTIIKAFKFYDEKRHRFDGAEEKGICRSDVLHQFQRKCMMTDAEALWAYTVLKRAVKAFFYQTPDCSIRSPIAEAVLLKEHEFIWQHAAIRTNQLFERYEHIFYNAQKNYDMKIMRIYKELHERLKDRANPVIIEESLPRGCIKKVIIGTKSPPILGKEIPKCVEKCQRIEDLKKYIKILPMKKFPLIGDSSKSGPCKMIFGSNKATQATPQTEVRQEKKNKSNTVKHNLPRCFQCNCPQLICDCKIDRDNGVVAIDCSQGPYECQWFRDDKNEKPDPCIEKRELHQCPVDCEILESSSDSEEDQDFECSVETHSDKAGESAEEEAFEETDNEES